MPTSFSGCSYLVLQPNYDVSTNQGMPQYYSPFTQIQAVAHMYINKYTNLKTQL